MTDKKQPITIEEQLSFIRDFDASLLPARTSKLKTDSTLKIIILRQLYNRICIAKRSFMCLIDNSCYHDAFLVAGHIFETCAIISDIKDNEPKTQIQKMKEYVASSIAGKLMNLLEFDDTNRVDAQVKHGYAVLVNRFEIYGGNIIKDKSKKSHSEIIDILCDNSMSNQELVDYIEKNYKHPKPKECVQRFYERLLSVMNLSEKEAMELNKRDFCTAFYNKYCEIKHTNIFSPEMDTDFEQSEILNLVVTPMVWVFLYLRQYGLGKPMLPQAQKSGVLG